VAVRVALTGGIGSGKSEVARRLEALGAVIVDADVLARAAVAPGSAGLARVVAEFGPDLLTDAGTLDRPALGRLVFADPAARARLEAIVHPEVRRRADEIERAALAADPDAVVVHDIPLLVEARGTDGFDAVVVVDVPAEEQVRRLVSVRGMSEHDARARVAAQASRGQRLAVATEVVDNTGTLNDLDERITALWDALSSRN